jgi:hypothetical protein
MLAGMLDAITGMPDLSRGRCVAQWDAWVDNIDDPAAVEQAIQGCQECPVLDRCAADDAAQARSSSGSTGWARRIGMSVNRLLRFLRFLDPTRWYVWCTSPLFIYWERQVNTAVDAIEEAA